PFICCPKNILNTAPSVRPIVPIRASFQCPLVPICAGFQRPSVLAFSAGYQCLLS
ncbi:unnamed protein product, partial [Staurois parvus]